MLKGKDEPFDFYDILETGSASVYRSLKIEAESASKTPCFIINYDDGQSPKEGDYFT
jgi:hypothetical protein